MSELEQLLERATRLEVALEQKAGVHGGEVLPDGMTNDAALDLAAQGDPAAPDVVELQVKVAELEELVETLLGVDEVKAAAKEVDISGPCPECGSTDRDELADGSEQCAECGFLLESPDAPGDDDEDGDDEGKGFDFDSLADDDDAAPGEGKGFDFDSLVDDDDLGAVEVPEVKAASFADGDNDRATLTELEVLQARRAALGL